MHTPHVTEPQSRVRPPAVAGMFYPEAPTALTAQVRTFLNAAAPRVASDMAPKALIVPHAGYVYSGAVAACAYAMLGKLAHPVHRVVMFGPAHRVPIRGLALPSASAFATPLGPVALDAEAVAAALTLPQVKTNDGAHAYEHSLEVQLPFLQLVLPRWRIAPFAVGDAAAVEVAEVIERLWGGAETLLVVSSDLSHYHPYAQARTMDAATADAVLALAPTLAEERACGAVAINALSMVAKRRGLRPQLLDLRNSGDTAGDRSRVVGYASFAFFEGADGRC